MTTASAVRIPTWTVADRCRKARETAGYEQGELARIMGVSRETVSNYERGRTKPRIIVINSWSLATGVSRQWLLDGTIPPDGPLAQLAELRTFNPKTVPSVPSRPSGGPRPTPTQTAA